jgi:hypothetical protein
VNGREEVGSSGSQETEALRQAQRGDANVFELLYRLHSARVFALCLRILKNTAEAEDLTQQAFLTIFRALRTFRSNTEAIARLPARSKGPSYFMTSMAANTERLRKSSLARRGLPSLNCTVLAVASASYCQDIS